MNGYPPISGSLNLHCYESFEDSIASESAAFANEECLCKAVSKQTTDINQKNQALAYIYNLPVEQRALLLPFGDACPEYIELITAAIEATLKKGNPEQRRTMFLHVMNAKQSSQLSEEIVKNYLNIVKVLNTNQAFHQLDLSGMDLRALDFRGLDLTGSDLGRVNLEGVNLTDATLDNITLSGAQLKGAIMEWVSLIGAYLSMVDMSGLNMNGANLTKVRAYEVNLSKSDLSNSVLAGADLRCANLRGTNLSKADMENAMIVNADLSNADVTGANRKGVIDRGTTMQGVKS